jgi:hypothetical protein
VHCHAATASPAIFVLQILFLPIFWHPSVLLLLYQSLLSTGVPFVSDL